MGAGIVGLACAWLLQRRGHAVLLLDPASPQLGASRAALGILMGQVFHRSSGRAWRLRQRGLALWEEWRRELAGRGHAIPWRPGLLLLAADAQDLERQRRLVEMRRRQGLVLEPWKPERLAALQPDLPRGVVGGLYSPADGQLDPAAALAALATDASCRGMERLAGAAAALEPLGQMPLAGGSLVPGPRSDQGGGGWRVRLREGGAVEAEWVVLTAGLASGPLLRSLGEDWPMQPVLGQAMELELPPEGLTMQGLSPERVWPGAVVWRGVNLVPRPDLGEGKGLWLGATLEPGETADAAALDELRDLGGAAPAWLRRARLLRHWQGLRPRPQQRPAPLLESVAPGLLLAAGHYRNGVLLAPASAEWVAERVEGGSRIR